MCLPHDSVVAATAKVSCVWSLQGLLQQSHMRATVVQEKDAFLLCPVMKMMLEKTCKFRICLQVFTMPCKYGTFQQTGCNLLVMLQHQHTMLQQLTCLSQCSCTRLDQHHQLQ